MIKLNERQKTALILYFFHPYILTKNKMKNKQNKKKLIALASLVVLLGVAAFAAFSSDDLQGSRRNKRQARGGSFGNMATPEPGSVTFAPHEYNGWPLTIGRNLSAIFDPGNGGGWLPVNLRNNGSCYVSNYHPMGMWEMTVENQPLNLTRLTFSMGETIGTAFKLKIGTSPDGSQITSKTNSIPLSSQTVQFPNINKTLQPGTYYVTAYGKYRYNAPADWGGWPQNHPQFTTENMSTNFGLKTNTTIGEFQSTNPLIGDEPVTFKTNSMGPVSNAWAHPNSVFIVGFERDPQNNYQCRK